MDFKKAILVAFFITSIVVYSLYYIESSTHIPNEVDNMSAAIAEKFDCRILNSEQTIIAWHQKIHFEVSAETYAKLDHAEVELFLAKRFPSFQYVDDFRLVTN